MPAALAAAVAMMLASRAVTATAAASETHDLAAEQPAVVERLRAIAEADALRDATEVPPDLHDAPP